MALVFRRTVLPGQGAPFVMELPPYRVPTLKGVLLHTWERGWMYLRKAGTVILAVSIVMWAAMTYPTADNTKLDELTERVESAYAERLTGISGEDEALTAQYEVALGALENEITARDLSASVAGRIGHLMEPAIEPLGFDWRIGVSLLAGFVAKEVVVGTMGTIYSMGGEQDEESISLREQMGADPAYSPAMAIALMVFTLIYLPCMVALAVWHKEAGSKWKWTAFLIVYTTALAWVLSFGAYNFAPIFGIEKVPAIEAVESTETPWDAFLKDVNPTTNEVGPPEGSEHSEAEFRNSQSAGSTTSHAEST